MYIYQHTISLPGHFTELMAGYSSYCDDIGLTLEQSARALQLPMQISNTTRNEGRSSHSDTTQYTVQQSTETPDTVTSHTPTDLPFHVSESFQTFEHHRVSPGFASLQGSYGSGDSTHNERGGDLSQFNATAVSTPWNRAT